MILKFATADGWKFVDGVKSCRVVPRVAKTAYGRSVEVIVSRDSVNKVDVENEVDVEIVVGDLSAYILSDSGKTVERIN